MGRGGKRNDAGRRPKFVGGSHWIHLAIPKALRVKLEGRGQVVEAHVLELIMSAHPDIDWRATTADEPEPAPEE